MENQNNDCLFLVFTADFSVVSRCVSSPARPRCGPSSCFRPRCAGSWIWSASGRFEDNPGLLSPLLFCSRRGPPGSSWRWLDLDQIWYMRRMWGVRFYIKSRCHPAFGFNRLLKCDFRRVTTGLLRTGSWRHPAGISIQTSFVGREHAGGGRSGEASVREIPVLDSQAAQTHCERTKC